MLITVAVCTWNHAALLRQTLDQMTRLVVPAGISWELLVVDNNCTDETPAVLDEFRGRLPLKIIFETKPGLSNARNAAVAAARGAYIIWTDDDVLVDEQWLAAYATAFSRFPEASIFGGPISPWFAGHPPKWLSQTISRVGVAYAVRDCASGDPPISDAHTPFGANMSFRTDALRTQAFDATLGRVGAGLLGGEETTMIRGLLLDGHTGRWVSGARVQHYIPRVRQSTRYLREFYASSGRTQVRLDAKSSGAGSVQRPRWIWREVVVSGLLFLSRRMWAPPSVWIDDLKRASTARGQFKEFGALQNRARDAW